MLGPGKTNETGLEITEKKKEAQVKLGGTRLIGFKYNWGGDKHAMVRDCWEWQKIGLEAKVHNGLQCLESKRRTNLNSSNSRHPLVPRILSSKHYKRCV
jgi:hypothetical protein